MGKNGMEELFETDENEPKRDVMDALIKLFTVISGIVAVLAPQFGVQYTSKMWIVIGFQVLLTIGIFKNELSALLSKILKCFVDLFKKQKFGWMRKGICALLDDYIYCTTGNSTQSFYGVFNTRNHQDPIYQRIQSSLIQHHLRMARSALFSSKDPFVGIACVHKSVENVHYVIKDLWRDIPAEKKNSENAKQFVIRYNDIIKKMGETFGNLPSVEILGEHYLDSERVIDPKKLQEYSFYSFFEFLV